jgi:methylenetetrahydrofolate--tRNA-(uracil-5-)-methyltransferase
MHRNTYLPSPGLLQPDYSVIGRPDLFFAGQITGVEGYVESAASGLVAGWQAALLALGQEDARRQEQLPSANTVIGALGAYISDPRVQPFQPMNANFGLLAEPAARIRHKKEKIALYIERSLAEIDSLKQPAPASGA